MVAAVKVGIRAWTRLELGGLVTTSAPTGTSLVKLLTIKTPEAGSHSRALIVAWNVFTPSRQPGMPCDLGYSFRVLSS